MTFNALLTIVMIHSGVKAFQFEKVDCFQINPIQFPQLDVPMFCEQKTLGWCQWNKEYNICVSHPDSHLIFKSYYTVGMSLVLWFAIFQLSFYFLLQHVAKRFVLKSGLFDHLDEMRQGKCVIYTLEVIVLPVAILFACVKGTIAVIWDPASFEILPPADVEMHLSYNAIVYCFLITMYASELIHEGERMRFTLQLHHSATILIIMVGLLGMNEVKDIDLVRTNMAISLYALLEPNVFLQLLLYRMNPNKYLKIHYFSTFINGATRLLVIAASVITFIDLCLGSFVREELFQNASKYPWFIVDLILMMPLNAVLNYTQWTSFQALIHMTKQVRENIKIRRELVPREQISLKHNE